MLGVIFFVFLSFHLFYLFLYLFILFSFLPTFILFYILSFIECVEMPDYVGCLAVQLCNSGKL